jgi:N-acetylglutamate synthase-like GNAT family acetyltransferase
MLIISSVSLNGLEEVKTFYEKVGYGGGAKSVDQIFLARIEHQLVGVVRLCPEMGVVVLRGMQILLSFQRQQIGTQLLKYCSHRLAGQSCYCIPWRHLRDFYGQIGFWEISSMEAPAFLRERLESYNAREMDVILMHKPAAHSPHLHQSADK